MHLAAYISLNLHTIFAMANVILMDYLQTVFIVLSVSERLFYFSNFNIERKIICNICTLLSKC